MQCLRHLALVPGSRNKLVSIDYNKIAYYKVQYLPPSYNGNVIFELLPSHVFDSTSKNTINGMDKWFNNHTWYCTITSNIHNSQSLTFRKSFCIGQSIYNNPNCDFLSRSTKRNKIDWSGRTSTPFNLGHSTLPDSTLVCKICKVPPTCVNFCDARIYYVLNKSNTRRKPSPC
jgi:hypothetical protein